MDERTDGLHTVFYRLVSLYVIRYLRSPAHSNWKSLVSLRLSALLRGVILDPNGPNELVVFKILVYKYNLHNCPYQRGEVWALLQTPLNPGCFHDRLAPASPRRAVATVLMDDVAHIMSQQTLVVC